MLTKSLQTLENTGLLPFLRDGKKLAVAHKLGGDNMGLLEANKSVIEILAQENVTQTFAVSAFRSSKVNFNTTSKLIAAGESQNTETILSILGEIEKFHTELLEEILKSSDVKTKKELIDYAKYLFDTYTKNLSEGNLENCVEGNDYMLGVGEKTFSLLSIGEVIAAKVFVRFLEKSGIPAIYIDTAYLKDIHPQNLSKTTETFLQNQLEEIFTKNPESIPIIPGYIGGIEGGILKKLKRGYTDFTGSRSAVGLYDSQKYDEVLLYIQKLYGFKSTDPGALGENSGNAKSLNHLSYGLVQRAISHKGAGAGLINPFSLDEGIISRKIPVLVGNPTDSSDIAIINETGNPDSTGVDLVLGRDYNNEYDGRRYGIRNVSSEGNHIIYLMGENIENLGEVFEQAMDILRKNEVPVVGGELKMSGKPEKSIVFTSKEDAIRAQGLLHEHFIEKK